MREYIPKTVTDIIFVYVRLATWWHFSCAFFLCGYEE